MKVLQTVQEMMANDPALESIFNDGSNWEFSPATPATAAATTPAPQISEFGKWEQFSDIGLFSSTSFPPFRKAKDIQVGVKFPIRAMRKVTLKHGETASFC